MGQASEFSILIAFSALSSGLLEFTQAMTIQIVAITTLIVSTYWTVWRYPTPGGRSLEVRGS